MKKAIIITLALLLLSPVFAQADDVTLNFDIGILSKLNGDPLGMGSVWAVIADVGSNGFGDLSILDPTKWGQTSDSTDIVLGIGGGTLSTPDTFFTTNDPYGAGSAAGTVATITLGTSGVFPRVGDPLLLVWYDFVAKADNGDGTYDYLTPAPGTTINYGTYRSNEVELGGGANFAWVIPAGGSSGTIQFLTEALGGTNPESVGRAVNQCHVVPEPIGAILALLGGGAMALRRRLNRRSA